MWWIIIPVLVLGIYYYIVIPYMYWKKRDVAHGKVIPVFGDLFLTFFQIVSIADNIMRLYNEFSNHKYFGIHIFHIPFLVIRDPEIIKSVAVKDFDHFLNHTDIFFHEEVDPLFGRNLFALKDKKWRNMRSTLSPAYTGNKMKGMFKLVNDCGSQMVEQYIEDIKRSEKQFIEVEMKDTYSRLSNDVIATTAFGIQVNSFKNRDNEFYNMGKDLTDFNTMRVIAINVFPSVMKALKMGIASSKVYKYFTDLVMETLKFRKENNVVRPDMLHLIMEAQKGTLKNDTDSKENDSTTNYAATTEFEITSSEKMPIYDEDIIAQGLIFFAAGFETSSAVTSFAAYEIAINPDIQERLQNEIDEVLSNLNGNITYETLQKMKYLDMVISETLRKWPPVVVTDRCCSKQYTLTEDGTKELIIEKNLNVWIPIFAIHRDANYYPEPDKFDPERFSDENRHNIQPYTYIPFGLGPRSCIGSRFALMSMKIGLIHLLRNFDLVVTANTQIPLKLKPIAAKVTSEKGIYIGLKRRQL